MYLATVALHLGWYWAVMKSGTRLITIMPILFPSESALVKGCLLLETSLVKLQSTPVLCDWISICLTRAREEWQHQPFSPSGRSAEFWLTRFDCSQMSCQEIFLILISSVTKVDQAVFVHGSNYAWAAMQLHMFVRIIKTLASWATEQGLLCNMAVLIHHNHTHPNPNFYSICFFSRELFIHHCVELT